jgi:DNA modification methylase
VCGDSTKKEDVERLMGGEKADMVFTDPPYGIDIVKGVTAANGGSKAFGRVRQPGGRTLGVMGGDSGDGPQNLTGRVGEPGIVKPRLYYPVIGDDKPFEPAFLLDIAPKTILWGANNYSSKLPDSSGWLVWNKGIGDEATFSACELAWTNIIGHIKQYEYRWSGMIRAGSRKDELKDRVHPTQKPVGLFVQILQDFEAVITLDLFLGSGSTLIACEKLDRRCYGMEIDEHYCDVIIKRWQDYTGKKAVKQND